MFSNNSFFQTIIPKLSNSQDKQLMELCHELYDWLSTEINKATQLEKKILIILGDHHFNKESLLTDSLAMRIVKEKFGINNFLIELPVETLIELLEETIPTATTQDPIRALQEKHLKENVAQNGKYIPPFVANFLGMNIASCELSRLELCFLLQQNEFKLNDKIDNVRENHMANVALSQQENTIVMVGGNHVKSLFDHPALKNQFHIIGINTLPFLLSDRAIYCAVKLVTFFDDYNSHIRLVDRVDFLNDPNKIKQIEHKIDTDNMTPESIISMVKNINLDQQPTPVQQKPS